MNETRARFIFLRLFLIPTNISLAESNYRRSGGGAGSQAG